MSIDTHEASSPIGSTHSQFVGSIPDMYDTHLGPLLFEFTATDMAGRLSEMMPNGGKGLEIAAGTGISTERFWRSLAPGSEILATDLNDAMLDYARTKRGALPGVSWRQADAMDLPFEDTSFDAVVCQFGIMFFPDKQKGLAEMARVLKPGGKLLFNVWDTLAVNRCAGIALETIGGFFENDPPDFLSVPFGYADIDLIKALIAEVGLSDVRHDLVTDIIERPDTSSPARGFVEGNPGILQIKQNPDIDPEMVILALAQAYETEFGASPTRIPLQAIVFSAVKS
ncbi:MAG: methyltransferase domain-containing protein [Rhodospirillaceae bacterium]|nr:methyltransferase domain-containing protein [Rhodospirillaceae bacterium]